MNDLIIKKLLENNIICQSDIDTIISEIKEDFVMLDYFSDDLQTNFGEYVEQKIESKFDDIVPKRKPTDEYDRETDSGLKIEIKSLRAMVSKHKQKGTFFSRALKLNDWKISGTFQQVKPHLYDYIIGLVVGKDDAFVYLIPTSSISSTVKITEENKIRMSGQHSGNLTEGQIRLKDCEPYKIGKLSELENNIMTYIDNQKHI